MRGLTSRQPSVVECSVSSTRGKPRSGFASTHGARLIDSTPPVSTSDASPASTAAACADRRLERGGAQAIHGHAGDRRRQLRQQQRHARDVAVLLAGAVRIPEDDVVDRRRVEPRRALDDRPHDVRGEVVRPHARQRAPVAAEGGADRVEHIRVAHAAGRAGGHHVGHVSGAGRLDAEADAARARDTLRPRGRRPHRLSGRRRRPGRPRLRAAPAPAGRAPVDRAARRRLLRAAGALLAADPARPPRHRPVGPDLLRDDARGSDGGRHRRARRGRLRAGGAVRAGRGGWDGDPLRGHPPRARARAGAVRRDGAHDGGAGL